MSELMDIMTSKICPLFSIQGFDLILPKVMWIQIRLLFMIDTQMVCCIYLWSESLFILLVGWFEKIDWK
jgi:hypothetical protein